MRITFGKPTTSPPTSSLLNFRVPNDGGSYLRFHHDWERADWNFESRVIKLNYKKGGLPQTVPSFGIRHPRTGALIDFTYLPDPWQRFWFESMCVLLDHSGYDVPMGEPVKWFVYDADKGNPVWVEKDTPIAIDKGGKYVYAVISGRKQKVYVQPETNQVYPLYPDATKLGGWQNGTADHRALTDQNSIDQFLRDAVLHLNMNNPDPIGIKGLGFGGNIVRELGYLPPNAPNNSSDFFYWQTFNVNDEPPDPETAIRETPWLFGFANEIGGVELSGREWLVSWFPQFKMFDTHFIYPHMSYTGWNWSKKAHMSRIGNGEPFCPYVNVVDKCAGERI